MGIYLDTIKSLEINCVNKFALESLCHFFKTDRNKLSINLFKNKMGIQTIGKMINEISFPNNDMFFLERLSIKRNLVDQCIINFVKDYCCEHFISDFQEKWYLGGEDLVASSKITSNIIKKPNFI